MKQQLVLAGIRGLAASWRIQAQGVVPAAPAVLAFWHDEMLPVWRYFATQGAVALTSLSSDGDLLAALLQSWNYRVVRGSSSRGGSAALDEMIALARDNLLLITPDGSRGPRHHCKAGAIVAAARSGAPLYLCRAHCRGYRLEKSWDKFLIPWPLARIELQFSGPFHIPAEADRSTISAWIEQCTTMLNRDDSLPFSTTAAR